ncbi:MAG TPA: hypothetical protein VG733_08345 [Chthoniobacteraceae bacterium]|nr:hypothetical protein [Chthoniobacteraceae bacterium]
MNLKSKAGPAVKIPVRKKTPLKTRPANPPVPLPRIILSQLNGVSHKVTAVALREGFLWLLLAVSGIVLVQCTLDWLFDLAWHIRLIFAILDLGLLGWLSYRYIFLPLQKPLSPEQAALRAELKYPALRTSLISAVQLAKNPEGSTRMVEILIQQVAKRAAQMDFRQAVDANHLKKLTIGAFSVAVVTAGLGAAFMPKTIVLIERLLLSTIQLPTQTIVVDVSGDFKVPAGETIELKAQVKEGTVIPKSGSVTIDYDGGKGSQTVTLTPKASEPGAFALTIPNVQQGFTYRFRLNDGRGNEFKVTILHGPTLAKVNFEANPPAYTGLQKTSLPPGNITIIAGGTLHIEGKADQDLKSAVVQLKGVDKQIQMAIGGDSRTVTADVQIPAQGLEAFSISMLNTDGIPSPNNTLYHVTVTPDKPPEITFAAGQAEDLTFVETDRPRILFKVIDDFQVAKVFLCVQPIAATAEGSDEGPNAQAPKEEAIQRIPIPITPAAALNFDYIWKTAGDSGIWKEGKTVSYWIEAEDNNNVTGPGVGKSGKRQWRIISIAEKQKELKDKEKEIADKMDEIAKKEQELQQSLGNQIKQESAPK